MVRSNDPFWNHVLEMNDGAIKCKFCGHLFARDTSVSRIKWHLSGEKGHGVAICCQVPKEVQEAAFLAMRGGNKRHKNIASSSNDNANVISSCLHEQNSEADNLARDVGRIQMAAVLGTEQGLGEGVTSLHAEAGNQMENMAGEMMHIDTSITVEGPTVDGHETREEASQTPDLVGQTIGRSWDEICNILMEDDIENGARVTQTSVGASSCGGVTRIMNEIRKGALPMTRLVGKAFENYKKTIWSWLMNDEVSSIGIYGMGGVGKTTLMTHIYNQLLKRPDTSNHVYWITVSQDFSISRLQNSIARHMGLDLSNEEEELYKAVKLSEQLMNRQKWVLILDDLWTSFELDKVGIPNSMKGCKVILTTRSEKVCERMDSQKKIKVKPLTKEEAWTLFIDKLGHDISLSPEVKRIAESITEECDGLPLGIITMAGTMKGVDDIHEWRNALEDLKQSRVRQDDMEQEVFRILRFSYMHLNDSALQQCFLYCALFPEDFNICRADLIAYLIDEGVIKGQRSREAEFDQGHSMLNKLEQVCLLERSRLSDDGRYVKMHDLIRDMAVQLQQENSQVMVKAGAQLKELPDSVEWTENLKRVSLMRNQIKKIPFGHSPSCPNLSTILLRHNDGLLFIANSFFEQLHGLQVLDLSYTGIENLPDSVSDLVSLTALLLVSCQNLRNVPSLEKLRALRRLDLYKTALAEMPQGMEWLYNLRYLRLNGCGQKVFPSGVLPNLTHLQVFILEDLMPDKDVFEQIYAPITVKGKEIACLKKLETLECHFEHLHDLVEFVISREEMQALSRYQCFVGQLDKVDYGIMTKNFCRSKRIGVGKSISRDGDFLVFPNDILELRIRDCNDARTLCNVSSTAYVAELEIIKISFCNSMESLLSSWFCSAPQPLLSNGIFSRLKQFSCCGCKSMKKLFPLFLLPNLANLEDIRVTHCETLEEIIATRDEEGVMGEESNTSYSSIIRFYLPKLRILKLEYLPELKSVFCGKMICNSLNDIWIRDCPKLKRIPISLPLLNNGRPSPPPSLKQMIISPKRWWESVVEWEHPNAKDVLLPFVWFGGPIFLDYSRFTPILSDSIDG